MTYYLMGISCCSCFYVPAQIANVLKLFKSCFYEKNFSFIDKPWFIVRIEYGIKRCAATDNKSSGMACI